MSKQCDGDGKCLEKVNGVYERRAGWKCRRRGGCTAETCPNFVVCTRRAPKWYFEMHHGLCQMCLDHFGRRLNVRQSKAENRVESKVDESKVDESKKDQGKESKVDESKVDESKVESKKDQSKESKVDESKVDESKVESEEDEEEVCPVCYTASTAFVEFPVDCGHFFCGKCISDLYFFDETRYHLSPVPFGCEECPNGCDNPVRGRQCECAEYEIVISEWMADDPAQATRWQSAEMDSIENYDDMAYASKKCPLCRRSE